MKGISDAIGGAVTIAAVSTVGDYLWANFIPHHRPIYGLIHGTLLFLAVGLFLGVRLHKPAIGAVAGALLGFLAAGGFYLLSPRFGYAPMFPIYIGVWLGLGLLNGRVLQEGRPEGLHDDSRADLQVRSQNADSRRADRQVRSQSGIGQVLVRSILAAIGTGVAFYAISGIWFPFNPRGWDYALHFAAWTVAYFPGFAALLLKPQSRLG